MTIVKKLDTHPYANCKVFEREMRDIHTGEAIGRIFVLRSYATDVVTVRETDKAWGIHCDGLYSMTTRRHIGWFLQDIGCPFTYRDAKRAYERDCYIEISK